MPTQYPAQVDKFLTNVSIKYTSDLFIADKLFPRLNVQQDSGLLGNYGFNHLRMVDTDYYQVGGQTPFPRVTSNLIDSQVYTLKKYGASDVITEEDRANFDAPFGGSQVEVDRTQDLTHQMLILRERIVAAPLTSTAIITKNTTLVGPTQYNNYTTSDPIGDFRVAREQVRANTGRWPNTAVMSADVFNFLKHHPAILDNQRYVIDTTKGASIQALANVMEVETLLIGHEFFNAAPEGQPDDLQPIWSKDIVFYYRPTSPSLRQQSVGYLFERPGMTRSIYKNDLRNPPRATEVLIEDKFQYFFANTDLAYLIKDAVA